MFSTLTVELSLSATKRDAIHLAPSVIYETIKSLLSDRRISYDRRLCPVDVDRIAV